MADRERFAVPNEMTASQLEEIVVGGNALAMVFLFSQRCHDCREYSQHMMGIASNETLTPLKMFSIDEDKYPYVRMRYGLKASSNILLFKDGVKFDECPLNTRGIGIIIGEMLYKKEK